MAQNQTLLRSNFVPAGPFSNIPDWHENPGSVPESSVFTEAIHDRLLLSYGRPMGLQEGIRLQLFSGLQPQGQGSGEVQAKFHCKNMLLQNCTAIQLEQVILVNAPTMLKTRGLLEGEELCGDLMSDDMVVQRRMNFTEMYGIVIGAVTGITRSLAIDLRGFLTQVGDGSGDLVGYYTLTDLFNLVRLGIQSFLSLSGYTSISTALFVDPANNGDICIFWSSTMPVGHLSINMDSSVSNFFQEALNFFGISSGPRAYTYNGTPGEVIRIFPRGLQSRSFNNASPVMTIHSDEMTQFRKFDSISFTEGGSLLGVLNCVEPSTASEFGMPPLAADLQTNNNYYRWTRQDGSLVSQKINFSKDQLLTEYHVTLWGGANSFFSSSFVSFNKVEAAQVSLIMVFRLW
jgi:hypothetical protein